MNRIIKTLFALGVSGWLSGCAPTVETIRPVTSSRYAVPEDKLTANDWPNYYRNEKVGISRPSVCSADSRKVAFFITFSGGGSRAAYFAAQILHEMDRIGEQPLTPYVDGIFSVSGGSLTAALFAMSGEGTVRGQPRPAWSDTMTDSVLSKPLAQAMLRQLAAPNRLAAYTFGNATRTDLLENAIESEILGMPGARLTLGDVNPVRPPIFIVSALATSEGIDAFAPQPFGSLFMFGQRDLIRIGVDPDSIPIAKAVSASAAFPGLLSPVVLPRFRLSTQEGFRDQPRYVHLIDGGNADNLGLLGVKHALLEKDYRLLRECDSIVVVSVDAFGKQGLHSDASKHAPSPVGLFFDHKSALASFDALLAANRVRLLGEFKSRSFAQPGSEDLCRKDGLPDEVCGGGVQANWHEINQLLKDKLYFVHLNFDSREMASQTNITYCNGAYGSKDGKCEKMPVNGYRLECEQRSLRKRLQEIPTKFGLEKHEMSDIKTFVSLLNHPKNICLHHLASVLAGNQKHDMSFYRKSSESCDMTEDVMIGESPVMGKRPRGRLFGDAFISKKNEKITNKDRQSFADGCTRDWTPTHEESIDFLLKAKQSLIDSPRHLID